MALNHEDRTRLIEQYAAGPAVFAAAVDVMPPAAMRWRPSDADWSVHEIVLHCADSETNGAGRIRYLLAESEPLILGYDQEAWAIRLDYHARPIEPALALIAAVRANTVPLLRATPAADWSRTGRHTEMGQYDGDAWLRIYGVHLHEHADQISANVVAWQRRLSTESR
jgi:hypothetical protein